MKCVTSLLHALLITLLASAAHAETLKPIRSIPAAGKVVALTFDDGVIPHIHEQMLDTCKEESVPVTFFFIGMRAKDRDLIQRAIDEGHEIGNHSMTHPVLPELSRDEIYREINGFQKKFKNEYGYEPVLFRAPRLQYDERVMEVLAELDLAPVNAIVGTRDYAPEVSAEDVFNAATREPKPGMIILMHEQQKTADVLPRIIAFYRERGYRFATVSELLEMKGSEL